MSEIRTDDRTAAALSASNQIMLFWHLGQVCSHLARDIPWASYDPIEKRRLDAVLAVLEQEVQNARQQITAKAAA